MEEAKRFHKEVKWVLWKCLLHTFDSFISYVYEVQGRALSFVRLYASGIFSH